MTDKPVIATPGENVWPFRLGDQVRDKISGLEGTAVERLFHMTGCDRFGVELPHREGEVPNSMYVDANRLELVGKSPSLHRSDEVPQNIHVQLGDKVKSLTTGIVGIATILSVPLFGAYRVAIEPGWDDKKKVMPEAMFSDLPFTEVITPYTPRPAEQTKPDPADAKKKSSRGATRVPAERRIAGVSR